MVPVRRGIDARTVAVDEARLAGERARTVGADLAISANRAAVRVHAGVARAAEHPVREWVDAVSAAVHETSSAVHSACGVRADPSRAASVAACAAVLIVASQVRAGVAAHGSCALAVWLLLGAAGGKQDDGDERRDEPTMH